MASKIKTSSTNAHNLKVLADYCDVNETLKNISQRWKMSLLYNITNGIQHFGQLKKAFPTLSDQILSKRLGELVAEGLANKSCISDTIPQQTLYTPTCKGNALIRIILELQRWGNKDWPHIQQQCCG
ncbi:winged helix-turn-helix transcriptional regulator [Chitinophaga flava]|nr:helix-turn-helix domain-containing protein [Chitinophaga flava]